MPAEPLRDRYVPRESLSTTVTATLPAAAGDDFDDLSRVENLPGWATEFARELIEVDGHHKVRNGSRVLRAHRRRPLERRHRHARRPDARPGGHLPPRVTALPPDVTAFTFTMFRQPGMPDTLFEAQHASLEREFAHIRSRFARE